MHDVIITSCPGYDRQTVRAAVRALLAPLGGMAAFIGPGERVLLKPNMLSAREPGLAVTTHPEILRAVIELVQEAGGIPLVGDSPGIGDIRRVAEKTGMLAVIQETGARLAEFTETTTVAGQGVFKSLDVARTYLEADRVINLPKLKTHEMMTMTCAVKNLFGSVVGSAKAGWHLKTGADRELFARMLLEIYLLRKPDLNIVDAVTAMEGDGPGSGDPKQVGLLLAGVNPVAVDIIAAEIAGIPKKLLFVERMAEKLGIDGADRAAVRLAGLALEEARGTPFRLAPLSDVQFGLPRFLKNRLRQQLTTRPVPIGGKCRLCSICVAACPPEAITVKEGKLVFDYHRCIRCFCCRELCPYKALDVKQGTILSIIEKFKK